jgi:hypothetical protein
MSGTFILDATETNLLASLDLDADDNYYGTALKVNAPGLVQFDLTLPDPAAADDATIEVQIIGCETADFSTGPVVPIAAFPKIYEALHNTSVTAGQAYYALVTCVDFTYIKARCEVIDGTNGDWNVTELATLYMRPWAYKRGQASKCVADTDTWYPAAGGFNPAA